MNKYTLHDAGLEDAVLLTYLITTAFEDQRGKIMPPSGAHNETPAKIRIKLEQGGGILAMMGAEAAGCVLYYPDSAEQMYLGRLAVLPKFRQQGLALAMVAAVEAKARAGGYTSVSLSVRVGLPQNRAFFERQGYLVTGYDHHEGYTEPTFVHMAKSLS